MSSADSPLRLSQLGARATPPMIAKLMASALETPGLLSLAAGFTDNASLPCDEVGRISAELAAPETAEVLQYGTNQGRTRLRAVLADRLNRLDRAQVATSEDVFVTNGSQQALYLAMQVLAEPGDIILVDRPSYFVFLEMLVGLGLQAVTLPIDERGQVDLGGTRDLLKRLDREGKRSRVKALYLVTYFSNPTGRSIAPALKSALGQVFVDENWVLPVLEDAAYRELYWTHDPEATSVLSLPAWAPFPKLYLGTLTKPFATGLKVGFGICTDSLWRSKMLYVKGHHDFGTTNFGQAILERALLRGAYDQHLARIRKVYAEKGRCLDEALRGEGVDRAGWSWETPAGGLYLWLKGPAEADTRMEGALCRRAVQEGVLYVPGDLCFGDEAPYNYMRLSFGVLRPDQLAIAGERLAAAIRRM